MKRPGLRPRPLPNVPLVHRPEVPAASAKLSRPPLLERKSLLVVDDEPPIVRLVSRILSSENYEVSCAESGPEALRQLDALGSVDLLITDLQMPEMSGRELATKVRARCPSVRVLYQTGFADALFADLRELGDGEAFIEKPFGAEGLLEATRLVMFGHISGSQPEADERENQEKWEDNRLRAKVVRLLKRLRMA